MPLTIPPFTQFQGQLVPLRGLWNTRPREGEFFVNAEIDWGSQNTAAIQFALSGNSPVALSQIVSLYVDNRRCGVDVDFLFPDSGFLLTVPAHAQGLFPVLTNALMFYAIGTGASTPDVTIVQILNSRGPQIALVVSDAQNNVALGGISALANASTALLGPTISGSVNTIGLSIELNGGAGGGSVQISLQDGTGGVLWMNFFSVAASGVVTIPVNLSGLNVRFRNGLNLVIAASSGLVAPSNVDVNIYYTSP